MMKRILTLPFILILLCCSQLQGQTHEDKFEKANQLRIDLKYDSAIVILDELSLVADANVQFKALTGKVRIAYQRNDFRVVDSLLAISKTFDESQIEKSITVELNILKAENLRARSKFREALNIHLDNIEKTKSEKAFEKQHARLLMYASATYDRISKADSSIYFGEKALKAHEDFYKEEPARWINPMNILATAYLNADRNKDAENLYLKGIDILEKIEKRYPFQLAQFRLNLSNIYNRREDYNKAIQYIEDALVNCEELNDNDMYASAYYSLGLNHFYIGDFGKARDYFESSTRLRRGLYKWDDYRLANNISVMAVINSENEDYDKALAYSKEAMRIRKKIYGPKSLEYAAELENISTYFLELNQVDSAMHYISNSNVLFKSLLGMNATELATNYFNFAKTHQESGNVLEAKVNYEKALAILVNRNEDKTENFGLISSSYAKFLSDQGDLVEAKPWIDKTMECIKISQGEELQENNFITNVNSLVIYGGTLSYFFEKYQNSQLPEDLLRFKVVADNYIKWSEQVRKQFTDPFSKSTIAIKNAAVYDELISFYQELQHESKDEQLIDNIFEITELKKSNLLRDLVNENLLNLSGIPKEIIDKERYFKNQLSSLSEKIYKDPENKNLQDSLFALKLTFNEFQDSCKAISSEYFNLKYESSSIGLADLQSKLATDQQFVIYTSDESKYYAIVISSQLKKLQVLGERSQVNDLLNSYRLHLQENDLSALDLAVKKLYDGLWKPIESKVSASKVVIIPDRNINALSFEGLKNDKGDFLIEEFEITYALSCNAYLDNIQKSKNLGVAKFIAPGFEDGMKLNYVNNLGEAEKIDSMYLTTIRQPWSLKLGDFFKNFARAKIFTKEEATESNIKQDQTGASIIHFATHAFADANDPMYSKLFLSKEMGEQSEDGYLHAYEIFGLDMKTDLTILGACETGVGKYKNGEGVISLSYATKYAGSKSNILSLWKVDEKTNSMIIKDFYTFLSDGESTSAALRKAKLKFLRESKASLRSPFYWSGLILNGPSQKIALESRNLFSISNLMVLLLGLAVLIFGVNYFRRR